MKIEDGFVHQKGAIYGFGNQKEDDTKIVLKISYLDQDSLKKLNKVLINNLGEERDVGIITHELWIQSKPFLETCSRNIVLNKAHDLIKKSSSYKRFKKTKEEIALLKQNWSVKMRELEIKGFTAKKVLHFSCESKKLSDLAVLKQQKVPGPFTSSKEIQTFINSCPDSKEKNKRMYIEVRFAKESLSLKRTVTVFKLKSGGNLPVTSPSIF